MKIMNSDISLLVHTCDAYEKFWAGMFYTLDFYWDYDFMQVYFANEEKDINDIKYKCKGQYDYSPDKRIKQILTGKTDKNGFSTRFIHAVEKIPTKYVIYMQEDMWLTRSIDNDIITELIYFMEKNNADSVKIHTKLFYYDSYILEPTDNFIKGQKILKQSEIDGNMLLTHNATIWKRDYILKHQKEGEDPWTNEIEGSKRMNSDTHSNWMYNIHWYCQPGISVNGEFSHEHINYPHIIDEMMSMNLKYNLKK